MKFLVQLHPLWPEQTNMDEGLHCLPLVQQLTGSGTDF